MAEKLITCSECQGMFDVGHIPPGREMKCPSCGNSLVVPGEEPQPIPVETRPRTVVAGSSPRQATTGGSSPRQVTASGSRVGTIAKRSTPLMRRVKSARPGGGTVVRGAQGGENQPLSSGRHPAAVQKKGPNVALIIGIAVVVLGGGGAYFATQGRNEKPKPLPVDGPPSTKAPVPAAAPGGTRPAAAAAPAAVTPIAAPQPGGFKAGSESVKVEGWSVDAALLAEVELKLRASWDKKGDAEIRKELVAASDKYFPVIVDRVRSDTEGVAKEAAAVANEMLKKYDIWFGKRGEDSIEITQSNDPELRMELFKVLRAAYEDRVKKAAAGGGTPSSAGTPSGGDMGSVLNLNVVDALRRGGQDREEMIEKMKGKPSQHVPDLVKQLEAVGEDKLGGRAVASALNELTNASIPVPPIAEYDGAAMKKKWEEWMKENAGKLK